MSTIGAPPIPERLVDALRQGRCVLFAGNGTAIAAGYPTWPQLLDELAVEDDQLREPTRRYEEGELELVAEVVRARLGNRLAEKLVRIYASAPTDLDLHRKLVELPFAGILTWSWDRTFDQLIDVPSLTLREIVEEASNPFSRFFYVRLSGDPWQPDSLAFTGEELRRQLRRPPVNKLLAHLVSTYTVLFVGVRPDNVEIFLSEVAKGVDPAPRHFALTDARSDFVLRNEAMKARYGVELIRYEPSPGHPEVRSFVAEIGRTLGIDSKGKSRRRRSQSKAIAPPPDETGQLEGARFSNIGPFEELELELGTGWNLLLGNNGCGKSTILRAIALGLCGDEPQAQEAARSLLRSGTKRGSIELRVGQRWFKTELLAEGRQVRAYSDALPAFQVGGRVALGFPALRGVALQTLQGPTSDGSPRPEVEDLLPLLRGRIDSRLDSTRQWLVNTSLRAHKEQKGQKLFGSIDSFFRILRALTPGVEFKLSRIDTNSWDVLVETPDGEVPIEWLSQGTSSILSWIGTLLQRMFEIHQEADDPTRQPALVLVDEIDAHMHPEWQQTLAPLLREHLPRLQVIATTHSPLVVGSLESVETYHFDRSAPWEKITVHRLADSFVGWRADQILTGPAFELHSTVSVTAREWMREYASLNARAKPTGEERERRDGLEKRLRRTVPRHAETSEERAAAERLEEDLLDEIRDKPKAERERIADEAERLLHALRHER